MTDQILERLTRLHPKLIDLGLEPAALEAALRTLPVEGWSLSVEHSVKMGLRGVKVRFLLEDKGLRLSVPATLKMPSLNSTCLGVDSSRCAAIFFPLSMILSSARMMAEPPTAIEREP